jgi:hypothetical protein
MYKRLGLLQKNIPYFRRAEENNGNEVQNKLRVDKENMGFLDPFWRCKVSVFSMTQQPLLPVPVALRAKGAHTRTSLAHESGWARVPMSQTRPFVECHEPDLVETGLAPQGLLWGSARRRLAIGSYVCGRSQTRLAHPQGHKHRQCEFCHLNGGTMSATMSKTLMSSDFLAKFLEECREMPVLWQISSADYSNRTKRDEAWDLLVQLTREKIPEVDLCFVEKKVDSIRASFRKKLRRVRDSRQT